MYKKTDIGRYIGRLHNLIRRRLQKDGKNLNCSGAEMRILTYLLSIDDPVYQKDIENEFFLRPPTATEVLKRMEKGGFITKVTEKDDARKKRLVATEKSLALKAETVERIHTLGMDITQNLSEEEIQAFCSIAEKMVENLILTARDEEMEEKK